MRAPNPTEFGMPPITPLSYDTMRLKWSRYRLRVLLKRWAVFCALGVVMLGGSTLSGGNPLVSNLRSIYGMVGLALLPLMQAAAQGGWMAFGATLAYALAGALTMLGLRPVLWSRQWADAERALPIAPRTLLRSDIQVVLLGLSLYAAVLLIGSSKWLLAPQAWLAPALGRALAMLLIAYGLSVGWGILMMRYMRRPVRWPHRLTQTSSAPPSLTALPALLPRSLVASLVVLPLRRGPAQRTARLGLFCLIALLAPAVGLLIWPALGPWWLAAYAALSLALTSRLSSLVDTELTPLHDECAALPILATQLLGWRRAVALLPVAVSLLVLTPLALMRLAHMRPVVGLIYWLATAGGNALQAVLITRREKDKASNRVVIWLSLMMLLVALASEIVP